MPENNFKSRLKELGVAFKNWFKPAKTPLTQAMLEQEMTLFVQEKGYDPNDPDIDIVEFQNEFIKYLKAKNYDFEGVEAELVPNENSAEIEGGGALKALSKVRKVSENLNDLTPQLSVFLDTRKMMPGLICYVIEKIEPTNKKPYVTYRPTPRVITSVHDSGVNGGTIFFTYNHKLTKSQTFNGSYSVVAEDEVIYSPLTKEHADYICRLLNIQSKQFYVKKMNELKKQKQLELRAAQQKQIDQYVK